MYDQSISHANVLLKTGGEGCDTCDFNQRGSSRQLKHAHKLDENVNELSNVIQSITTDVCTQFVGK